MEQGPLMYWLEVLSKIAVICGVITAMAAALIAYLKFKSDRASQEFASAMQIYRKYLELAFEHPEFAEPEIYKIDEGSPEFSKYEWFVSILLRACEEMLEHLGDQPGKEWSGVIVTQLGFHKKYLKENAWFLREGKGHYSPGLVGFIDRATA